MWLSLTQRWLGKFQRAKERIASNPKVSEWVPKSQRKNNIQLQGGRVSRTCFGNLSRTCFGMYRGHRLQSPSRALQYSRLPSGTQEPMHKTQFKAKLKVTEWVPKSERKNRIQPQDNRVGSKERKKESHPTQRWPSVPTLLRDVPRHCL